MRHQILPAKRPPLTLLLAILLLGTMVLATTAQAAKKKGGGKIAITKQVGAPIPDAAPGSGPAGLLSSEIEAGKRFRGRRIRDVNVTVQTTGASGIDPAGDLDVYLTAPNGATTLLFSRLVLTSPEPAPSIGPLTLDDESPLEVAFFDASRPDPLALYQPWTGTGQPRLPGLWVMDNGPAKGTWKLNVVDDTDGETSVLTSWGLNVTTGKPYATK